LKLNLKIHLPEGKGCNEVRAKQKRKNNKKIKKIKKIKKN
jgi:hypothetical protein